MMKTTSFYLTELISIPGRVRRTNRRT